MTPFLAIDLYSHGARLSGYSYDTFRLLTRFLERLNLKEPRHVPHQGMVMELKKRFYGLTENKREIFVHRHHIRELLKYLGDNNIPEDYITFNSITAPVPTEASYTVKSHFVQRDYQTKIIDSLGDDHYSKRVDLQTGGGKTLSALWALSNLGCRAVIMVQPKYFGIWKKALLETFDDIEGRFCTVSGSAELQAVIDRALEGDLGVDVVIISAATYRTYIESYERFGQEIDKIGYNVPPPRFHEALGMGLQINDEFQDDPGLVFRTDIFTNVRKQIYLSATPYTGSDYVTRMIDVMLPEDTKVPLPDLDVYINVISLVYNDVKVKRKDYLTPRKNTYNHTRYEDQLLKAKRRLENYQAMVRKIINGIYIRDRVPGQKLLILCAKVDFIHHLTKHLNAAFPTLKVGSHVSGSDYQKLLSNDITVSTIKSSGTGVDIPDLREVLMLQATDSKKDNIQVLGRLRRMKNFPDVTPRFTYVVCQDIPQHIKYHKHKKEYFSGRVLNHRVMRI